MNFIRIKTKLLVPPKDSLYQELDKIKIQDKDILVVTSKVVSIHEGRCIKIAVGQNKDKLILQEAEKFLPRKLVPGQKALLTIKHHTLIAASGIDTKNGNGYYILWPKNPQASAKKIWLHVKRKNRLRNFGLIITDSHSIPLRHGTLGISIGSFGFDPLKDYTHQPALFPDKRLKYAKANIADGLASAATIQMGEGNEQTPLVLIHGADFVEFTDKILGKNLYTKFDEDIYLPLLQIFRDLTKQK